MRGSEREAEFVDFVRAHRSDLVRTAVLLCAGDEAYAEDLVQTTLTKLYLAWAKVRRADRPLAYARTSLTNAFFDERRRAHRRRETSTGEDWALDSAVLDDDRSLRQVVLAALGQLGPRQRAVVVLRHWHDLDVIETARILGCSEGTVKSQNARALAHLRAVLGPERLLVAGEA
ncbi:SigE family RNA polymerase sigma factor [Nocardioides marmorisolisilvae]|uniref:SigE family RNA polymerase sigma factor n=1 Tax=Nocardioides marmorisolisilvae TaxID=1542737 RepID=A0A3N0DNU3_9ACTN|nr:SigE family RNA polymerase sigma factor [Nocardioides marmorisolisilvae]RNL77325.1 SigE family RNA polymerase sigma factor [Nocardioides marmorisolisilvae]